MGLEGFSMGNMGLNADLNSAQMVTQVEQIAQKDAEIIVKEINKSDAGDFVKRKKEQSKQKDEEENEEDEDEESNESESEEQQRSQSGLTEEDFENLDPKDFAIILNSKTNFVELINKKDGKILETMPADDLMDVISKLNYSSSVVVNRKI